MTGENALPAGKRETMLVVDDVELNRAVLKHIFEDFNLLEAVDGNDAMEQLRKFKDEISVVLLDIVMPEKDGLEVLREMREDETLSGIPVIITSAANERENGLKAIALGAMDYVSKPVEPALVKLRVASALQKREGERLRVQNSYLLLQREEELRHQKELRHLAEHDSLTGLYNKDAFFRRVAQLFAENPQKEYVLLSFDVERFKVINELFGFQEGDRLLRYIAQYLMRNALPGEAFCRLDGDNFALCAENSAARMDFIRRTIGEEMKRYPLSFDIKITLGCYVAYEKDLSVEAMLDRAHLAKRSIKGNFQTRCVFYNDTLRREMLREQAIVGQMEAALAAGEFQMYLQGQYNYQTGTLVGAEALARWLRPGVGIISPDEFIPIFERNGFIQQLDAYMWEQACRCLRRWLDENKRAVPLHISVNISRMDIYNEGLCDLLFALIEKYRLPPQYLKLEITESAYVQNPRQLSDIVEKLRAHGFFVEIDDFGSGYSSLNTLKDLHADVLKLDMKFLSEENPNGRRNSILYHVISMAKSLGLSVIAEGVETKEQADFLLSVGCELMQGYYFFKPIAVEEFEKLI